MKDVIESAWAWFIASFMLEFVDNYERVGIKKSSCGLFHKEIFWCTENTLYSVGKCVALYSLIVYD